MRTRLDLSTMRAGLQWWQWRTASRRLEVWLKAILGGTWYAVHFDDRFPYPGGQSETGRKIVLNPAAWPSLVFETWRRALDRGQVTPWLGEIDNLADFQWLCCKAVAAHEVGHARYSGSPPEGNLLARLDNTLDDQRVERGMTRLYPVLGAYFNLAGDAVWLAQLATDPTDDSPFQVLGAALLWRWEHDRPEWTSKICLSETNRERWERVRPLVEAAWDAPTPEEVIEAAREILRILELPEDLPEPEIPEWLQELLRLLADAMKEARGAADGEPERLPARHAATPDGKKGGAPPLLSEDAESVGGHVPSDNNPARPHIDPEEYGYLEDAARPTVARLVAALQLPQPDHGLGFARRGRRLSVRRAVRDLPDPFRARSDPGDAPLDMVVDVLGDRSGSMGDTRYHGEDRRLADVNWSVKICAARLGVMMLHLALQELDTPHAIHLFDDHVAIKPEYDRSSEMVKGLIAAWQGETGEENVSVSMEAQIPKLLARPEPLKVMLILHDGHPVAGSEKYGSDAEGICVLQDRYKQQIWFIGVYLGTRARDIELMRSLFPHLVACEPEHFADHLGRLLRQLWAARS